MAKLLQRCDVPSGRARTHTHSGHKSELASHSLMILSLSLSRSLSREPSSRSRALAGVLVCANSQVLHHHHHHQQVHDHPTRDLHSLVHSAAHAATHSTPPPLRQLSLTNVSPYLAPGTSHKTLPRSVHALMPCTLTDLSDRAQKIVFRKRQEEEEEAERFPPFPLLARCYACPRTCARVELTKLCKSFWSSSFIIASLGRKRGSEKKLQEAKCKFD